MFFFYVEKGAVCFLPEKKKQRDETCSIHNHHSLWERLWYGSIIIQNKVASAFSALLSETKKWQLNQHCKVEIFLEQREVVFLSPSKICENLNFSTEIQIFANFAGW